MSIFSSRFSRAGTREALTDTADVRVEAKLAPLGRVLYVVAMDPSSKFGSMEEQMMFIADRFQEQSSVFLPLFICADSPKELTDLEQATVPIACLDMTTFQCKVALQLLELVRRHRIDIVHWNFSNPIWNGYLWWLTLLRPRVTHYFTEHSSELTLCSCPTHGWKGHCKRLLLRRYAKVLCPSQFVCDCLKAESTWSRVICCRHFINVDRFKPNIEVRSQFRAAHGAEGKFVVLTVAHLIREKGVDVLLRALALLPDSVIVWVVGGGAEAATLRQLTAELGLSPRVVFHGHKRRVEPYMQGADCFVCPSLWAEAAGLVNLEAQASGLPVIASDTGGIPEYVIDGQTGFLFPKGDVAELADRILRLTTDLPLRKRLGKAARALVEDNFSPAARLSEIINNYRS